MSRTIRLTLAAAALASVVPAVSAFAEPDPPRPICRLYFDDTPMFTTSPGFPVHVDGPGRPSFVC